jgi:hypothetical protein
MKIGDKVRFLSDTGGGIVSGFQKGNIVLVEDEDGFQIPAPMNDVVVIDTNEYNFVKTDKFKSKPGRPVLQKDDSLQQPETLPKEEKAKPLSGTEYLASKSLVPDDEEAEGEVDEQLEARVTRLEMQLQKMELRLLALENKAYRRKPQYYKP